MSEALPWLPYLVISFLDGYLKPDMFVFEWGSGGSTIYLAERVRAVVSVEHNREWYEQVPKFENVNALLIEPENGHIREDKADPTAYYAECLGDVNLKMYASAVDHYGAFDLILVDGRARASCLMHAVSHVKPGGVLVLDNTERTYYLEQTEQLFRDWDRADILGHGPRLEYAWQAVIFRRPEETDDST